MTTSFETMQGSLLPVSAEPISLLQTTESAFAWASQGGLSIVDLFNTAQRLTEANSPDIAIQLYRTWLEHTDSPIAYVVQFNLGVTLTNIKDDIGAEAAYRAAIKQKPTFIEGHFNLGTVLERTNRPEEALAMWRAVLTFVNMESPADRGFYLQALNNLGRLMEIRKELVEAEAMFRQSLKEDPKQMDVMTHWVHIRQKLCEWPVYRSVDGITVKDMLEGTSPLAILSASDDPAQQLETSRRYVDKKVLKGVRYLSSRQSYGHERLRIGYLSSDFCAHAVSILTAELYALHDRSKVEVFGFCWSHEDGSPLRARVISGMDHHIKIGTLSDEEAACLIRSHEIDILIDLHGLTRGTRHNILSYRPAPVQITWLGFPGPTALPEIDYVLSDPFLIPPELEHFFTEKPLHMPHTFQINDRQRIIGLPVTRESCNLPEDAFVFCSFNSNFKFTPEVFGTWMRILKRVPGSILWLVADNEGVRESLCKYAEKRGIVRERLHFAGRVGTADYLARFQLADLFLDTFPFGAGTTASDALWAGLPLLTYTGHTFASRMAGSLLKAVDLPELITYSLKEYENKAVELAKHPERVAAMKKQLIDNRMSCVLFDTPRFVRDLEEVLLQVAIKEPVIRSDKTAEVQVKLDSASTMPLVSVLIPTHNRPDYLEIALKSVLEQSYENIEIVISDNGDDTLSQERIAPYLQRHSNITYYRKQGMTSIENFHKCLELSNGEYINYLMDDDVFHPEKIKRMMHYYINYPNIGLVTSFRQLIDEHGNNLPQLPGTERMFPIDTVVKGQSLGKLILSNGTNLIGEPTTVLVRRSDVGDIFGSFAGRHYVVLSDIAIWLSILATRDCVYISDPLSYFRIHAAQDQRGSMMKIRASIEWFGLFIDAHKNKMFLEDNVEFLGLLSGKLAGFSSYIALNYIEIRDSNCNMDEIYAVIQQGYQLLFEKLGEN